MVGRSPGVCDGRPFLSHIACAKQQFGSRPRDTPDVRGRVAHKWTRACTHKCRRPQYGYLPEFSRDPFFDGSRAL
jgi:hypothetical protein